MWGRCMIVFKLAHPLTSVVSKYQVNPIVIMCSVCSYSSSANLYYLWSEHYDTLMFLFQAPCSHIITPLRYMYSHMPLYNHQQPPSSVCPYTACYPQALVASVFLIGYKIIF